jgi:hypothetical protein
MTRCRAALYALLFGLGAWSAAAQAGIITERVGHCALQHFAGGVQARFCATSVLGGVRDYGPQNLFDGNPATAWCEGAPGTGKGERIEIAFSRPQVVKTIMFMNGAADPRSNLVRTLSAIWPDGSVSSIAMPARHMPFVFTPAHARPVTGLSLRIEQVSGARFPDTCLTEVRLSLAQP